MNEQKYIMYIIQFFIVTSQGSSIDLTAPDCTWRSLSRIHENISFSIFFALFFSVIIFLITHEADVHSARIGESFSLSRQAHVLLSKTGAAKERENL